MRGWLKLSFASVCLWQLVCARSAAAVDGDRVSPINHHLFTNVPTQVRITLESDKKEYFLGENVLVHLVLANTGAEPFQIDVGGDYQAASREQRFVVTATDTRGYPVKDPDPSGSCMGGLSSRPTIKPGHTWSHSLPLMRYCSFEQPGHYSIRVTHDFGWREEEGRRRPIGETDVTFRLPDVHQAEAVVAEMERMGPNDGSSYGTKRPQFADFATLRYAAYLQPLAQRVARGFKPALQGIGQIETAEATAELIKLLDHPSTDIAIGAAHTYNARLPDPELEGKLPARSPFRDPWRERRKELAERTWNPKFTGPVRAHARKLLQRDREEAVTAGAFMIECLGVKEDQPDVIAAIDRSLAGMKPRRGEQDNLLDPPGASRELLRAISMLVSQGGEVPRDPKTAGEIICFLHALNTQPAFRPAGWEEECPRWMDHGNPFVREFAIRNIPLPWPEPYRAKLLAAFADQDLGVQRAACEWVRKTNDDSFAPPVLTILASACHFWLLNAANNAAFALGMRLQACDTWAERLDEAGMFKDAISILALVVKHPGGSTGLDSNISKPEILAIKKEWKQFLAEHGDEIAAGKEFEIGDPVLRPELFGRAFKFRRSDNTVWPPNWISVAEDG